ncbi:MAG TPA: DNRLRE domain-containing protein, partial [Bacteroidales bacterium]|nr:DNRLRE domain-containing protein [Bacteroidales bacterium]
AGCSSGKNLTNAYSRLVLQPGGEEGIDAFIEAWPYENYSNTNWSSYKGFAAAAWTAGGIQTTARSLLKFDLKSIPAQKRIRRATLSLYSVSLPYIGEGHSSLSGPNDFIINRVISEWDEKKVTWNTQPRVTREGEIILPPSGTPDQDYTNIDVTELVQFMIDNPSKNYGIMIRLLNESYYRSVVFGSSDYPNPEKRPKLVIEF